MCEINRLRYILPYALEWGLRAESIVGGTQNASFLLCCVVVVSTAWSTAVCFCLASQKQGWSLATELVASDFVHSSIMVCNSHHLSNSNHHFKVHNCRWHIKAIVLVKLSITRCQLYSLLPALNHLLRFICPKPLPDSVEWITGEVFAKNCALY